LGRPTLITDDLTKRFCDMISVSGSIETAIARTGIGRETYYRWLRKVRKTGLSIRLFTSTHILGMYDFLTLYAFK
jgi:transposase